MSANMWTGSRSKCVTGNVASTAVLLLLYQQSIVLTLYATQCITTLRAITAGCTVAASIHADCSSHQAKVRSLMICTLESSTRLQVALVS